MAKSHKSQRWIPRSYLRAWADPAAPEGHEPFVHVFSKDGQAHRKKAPVNVFAETDLYTIKLPDAGRDLQLEHGLSDLEAALSGLRKNYLFKRQQLPAARWVKFMAFVAAMQSRTPLIRDHHMKFWTDVQDRIERLERHMKAATSEERMRRGSAHFRPVAGER